MVKKKYQTYRKNKKKLKKTASTIKNYQTYRKNKKKLKKTASTIKKYQTYRKNKKKLKKTASTIKNYQTQKIRMTRRLRGGDDQNKYLTHLDDDKINKLNMYLKKQIQIIENEKNDLINQLMMLMKEPRFNTQDDAILQNEIFEAITFLYTGLGTLKGTTLYELDRVPYPWYDIQGLYFNENNGVLEDNPRIINQLRAKVVTENEKILKENMNYLMIIFIFFYHGTVLLINEEKDVLTDDTIKYAIDKKVIVNMNIEEAKKKINENTKVFYMTQKLRDKRRTELKKELAEAAKAAEAAEAAAAEVERAAERAAMVKAAEVRNKHLYMLNGKRASMTAEDMEAVATAREMVGMSPAERKAAKEERKAAIEERKAAIEERKAVMEGMSPAERKAAMAARKGMTAEESKAMMEGAKVEAKLAAEEEVAMRKFDNMNVHNLVVGVKAIRMIQKVWQTKIDKGNIESIKLRDQLILLDRNLTAIEALLRHAKSQETMPLGLSSKTIENNQRLSPEEMIVKADNDRLEIDIIFTQIINTLTKKPEKDNIYRHKDLIYEQELYERENLS